MDKIIVNVEGAVYKDNKWLLIKRGESEDHAPGILSFIGGTMEVTVEPKKSLERTLEREFLEEVGVVLDQDMQYVSSSTFISDNGNKVLDVVFLCRIKNGEPKKLNNEVAEILWMTTEEILASSLTPPWLKENIELISTMAKD